ncbi:hypothetical protein NIES2107_07540 [Nostoc carneum NIES-2107]|nr:hypothetical protein NIES2107_07540 [Nostoc carneum NIES-2107]
MMFHGIEQEFSDGEPWSFRQCSQLPPHLKLVVEHEQGQRDIWEFQNEKLESNTNSPKLSNRFKLRNYFALWFS